MHRLLRAARAWPQNVSSAWLVACASGLGGCVAQDIGNGLQQANARLAVVETDLGASVDELKAANSLLTDANARLLASNGRLEAIQGELPTIDESLKNLDVHLASLRTTIGAVDEFVPFVEFGDAPTPGERPSEAPDAPAGGENSVVAPGGAAGDGRPSTDITPAERRANAPRLGEASAGDAAASRMSGDGRMAPSGGEQNATATSSREQATVRVGDNRLTGPWVASYPEARWAMVLLPSGRFVLHDSQRGTKAEGTWARSGATLTLTPDGGGGDLWLREAKLIYLTARSLTMTVNGELHVLARP